MTLPKPKTRKGRFYVLAVLLVLGIGLFMNRDRFFASHSGEAAHASAPQPPFTFRPDWPQDIAAAAVGLKGYGPLSHTGDTKKRPIASVAKVITALALLEKKPLKTGEEGPLIPITEADEQIYRDYVTKNGTVVLVKAGEPITYHQALEGMLLPSANNIADTTAIWAFGSLKNYSKYANDMLRRMGLADTTIGIDASGLDPSTQSTASDLVRIGEAALKNPIIASIVAMPSGQINYAGPIPNYNAMVTKHGYTGIKPGESIQAGNTLLFSTDETINGKNYTVIGAILGSEGYRQSNAGALQIVDSLKTNAQQKSGSNR